MPNNTSSLSFTFEQWYGLSAGLTSLQAWQDWAKLLLITPNHSTEHHLKQRQQNVQSTVQSSRNASDDLTFDKIPAMMRRRMSTLSKLAVQVALTLLEQQQEIDYLIFASRHGELTRTSALIEDILKGEAASPIAFSQSVHNTAAGLTTIASAKPIPLTSIAAGVDTFQQALIEAYAYLAENPHHRVLIVDFDQPLPSPYQQYEDQAFHDYACGFILTTSTINSITNDTSHQYTATLKTKRHRDMSEPQTIVPPLLAQSSPLLLLPQSLQILAHMLGKQSHWSISGARQIWHWQQVLHSLANHSSTHLAER